MSAAFPVYGGPVELRDDQPMQHSKHTEEGVAERRALVEQRIQGIDVTLDAAAALPEGVTALTHGQNLTIVTSSIPRGAVSADAAAE